MFVPALVSEREAGQWEDCVWAAGVAFANGLAGANDHPATRAEYEGLRFDATGVREGNGDGSNLHELATGLEARYGLTAFHRGGGWADALSACPVGSYLVVQGSCAGLPARLQVTSYRGPHCALLCRTGPLSGAWLDPLKPAGSTPAAATIEEVRAFYETLPGAEWIAGPTIGRSSSLAITVRRQLGDVAEGVPFTEVPGGAVVGTFQHPATVETLGVPMDASPDHLNLSQRAVFVTTAKIDGVSSLKVVYVAVGALKNLRDVPASSQPGADVIAAAEKRGAAAEWDRWVASIGIPARPS